MCRLPAPADNPDVPPSTPMYDSITTNLPHPIMCYPSFWFPPSTALFPKAKVVEDYLRAYAEKFGLREHIKLNAKVISARHEGDLWHVKAKGVNEELSYERLIVANGHYSVPKYPSVPGLNSWRTSGLITHSAWYRTAKRVGSTVLVVGGGYSGQDIAEEMSTVCDQLIHSVSQSNLRSHNNIDIRGRLVRFSILEEDNSRTAYFDDGTCVSGIDHVFLATGYLLSCPFLKDLVDGPAPHLKPLPDRLYNDGRFLYPISRQLFPVSESQSGRFPLGSCAFIGLAYKVAPLPLFEAQARAVAHVFTHPSVINVSAERQDVLDHLALLQSDPDIGDDRSRLAGSWHKFAGREQFDYRDWLHEFAGLKGEDWKCPEWCVDAYTHMTELRVLWKELVETGEAVDLVKGVGEGGNHEWVELLQKLVERAKKKGISDRIPDMLPDEIL